MRILCRKKFLIEELKKCEGIALADKNISALAGVLIVTYRDFITISATNLDFYYTTRIEAEVIEEGKALMPVGVLLSVIKGLPCDTVEISEIQDRWFEISYENIMYRIGGLEPLDFPCVPSHSGDNLTRVSRDKFIKAAANVLKVRESSNRMSRYVQLVLDGATMQLVTTDSYRRHSSTITCVGGPFTASITKKALALMIKCLGKGDVWLAKVENHIVVKNDTHQILVVISDEGMLSVPSFDRNVLCIDYEDFKNKIIDVSRISSVVRLSVTDRIKISASSPQVGEAWTEIEFQDEYNGQGLDVHINAYYVLDAFANRSCSLYLPNENSRPLCVCGTADVSINNLVMPLR